MKYSSDIATVWIFNGVQSHFPSGVFSSKELAEAWIASARLSGTLTRYPIDVSVYDWAIAQGLFKPKKESERSALFIGRFSSASQDHKHYEDGIRLTGRSENAKPEAPESLD